MKKHNFSAGPSILPQSVIKDSAAAILNFADMDLSLIEVSHRSPQFDAVVKKARQLALELAGLDNKGYTALFLQGGASLQFLMSAYNLMPVNGKAAYIDTGAWSSKAIKEANILGEAVVVASSKDKGYNYIPKNYSIPQDVAYVHITTNNTIFGTQYNDYPEVNVPLVADMSSDIFSKAIDFSKFDLIYAGAQKNIGASGTTLVIVKEDILGKTGREIPTLLNYETHIKKDSLFHTPSVFSIYVSMKYLEWVQELGGVAAIEKINREKAALLYDEIDRNPYFKGFAAVEDRSLMNVTFNLTNETVKERFDKLAAENGIHAIKGHRSVGGYRASIYNAMPIESVQVLVDVMKKL